LLTLLVLPALYERFSGKEMPLGGSDEQDTPVPDFGRVEKATTVRERAGVDQS